MTREASERGGLEALKVGEIMVHPVRTVDPAMSVCELVRLMAREQISGAPVVDDRGRLVGVVSASDVMQLLAAEREVPSGDPLWDVGGWEPGSEEEKLLQRLLEETPSAATQLPVGGWGSALENTTVADIMTPATFTIAADSSVRELAAFLTGGRIHRCLVVEQGRLVGIVTSSDIVRALGCGTIHPS